MGARFNPETGRAELDGVSGFMELITSGVYLSEYAHVITSAWLVAGSFVAGISIWWMVRTAREGSEEAMAQSRKRLAPNRPLRPDRRPHRRPRHRCLRPHPGPGDG